MRAVGQAWRGKRAAWRRWRPVLLRLLALYPVVWFYEYFRGFVPGGGPQGLEAVALLGLLYFFLWTGIVFADAGRLRALEIARAWRWAARLAPCAALWLAMTWDGPALPAAILVAGLLALPRAAVLTAQRSAARVQS